jgi:hypothetical protein
MDKRCVAVGATQISFQNANNMWADSKERGDESLR